MQSRATLIAHVIAQLTIALFASTAHAEAADSRVRMGTDPAQFKWLLNREFSTLAGVEGELPAAGLISLDTKDASTSYASSWLTPGGSLLGVKVRGASADGVTPIFRHTELNTDIDLHFQWSRLALGRQSLSYLTSVKDAYDAELAKLKIKRQVRQSDVSGGVALRLAKLALQRTRGTLDILQEKIDKPDPKLAQPSEYKDSLRIELVRATIRYLADSTDFADLERRSQEGVRDEAQLELNNWYGDEVTRLRTQFPIVGIAFGWHTFAYTVTNRKLRLFDPTASPESQVTKETTIRQRVGWQYSYYSVDSGSLRSWYSSFGVAYVITDNRDDLTPIEITETKTYVPAPTERVSTKKFTAYQGDFRKNVSSVVLSANLYSLMLAQAGGGPHIGLTRVGRRGAIPRSDVTVGWLFSSKRKEGDETRVNVEFFATVEDAFNELRTGNSIMKRSTSGLKASVPFAFPKGL